MTSATTSWSGRVPSEARRWHGIAEGVNPEPVGAFWHAAGSTDGPVSDLGTFLRRIASEPNVLDRMRQTAHRERRPLPRLMRVGLVSDSDDDDPGVRILVDERAHCERTLTVHADRECRD
jgi:hypothetical protein